MFEELQARFEAGAEDWTRYNREPLGCIRHEVTWRNLAPRLPDVRAGEGEPRVLDVGGGSGEIALRLVQHGYRVWLVDYAASMLDQARQAAESLPEDAHARLTFQLLSANKTSEAFAPGFFDAILCHTLIEYLPEPREALRGLACLLRDGGLLSLSFVNRHAEVLRQVWKRSDPDGALAKLEDGIFYARLFDVPGRAYTAEEVSAWLPLLGLTVTAICGVRAFADQVPPERLADPAFLDDLLRLEVVAAHLEPYRQIARYVQLFARKGTGPA
ncbi:MAG: methyltransferase [Anaerolineae bacterium]|jgi:S-adenosylmethionine-dependent methyltransferase